MSKKYLLVDGYNIIYAWDDLKELLDTNVDAARGKLLDLGDNLCVWDKVKLWDPEQASDNGAVYPITRSYSMVLQVSF